MPSVGLKRKHAGLVVGHGYHSVFSGNYYTFLGVCKEGFFHFFRRFSQDWQRLTKREALRLFDVGAGRADEKYGIDNEDKLNLNAYAEGGRI